MRPITTGVFERTFDAASTEKISVRGDNGGITFRLHDGPDVRVKATVRALAFTRRRAERLGAGTNVVFATNRGEADAHVQQRPVSSWLGNVEVDFDVRIPRNWTGRVSLKTDNGPIVAEHDSDRCLHYALLSGPRGNVHAHTSNDAIRVADARLSGNNRLRTSNGRLTVEGALTEDAACHLATSNDHVAVTLSEPDVAFDMTAGAGRIQLPADVHICRLERERIKGRIGKGTARLVVRTSNGAVRFAAKT